MHCQIYEVLPWLQVVMNKGGAKLDMKGRCSAGQKVQTISVIALCYQYDLCLGASLISDQACIGKSILY